MVLDTGFCLSSHTFLDPLTSVCFCQRRLFLIGYWLIQACNAIGITVHYTICIDLIRTGHPTEPANGNESKLGNKWWTKIGIDTKCWEKISWNGTW